MSNLEGAAAPQQVELTVSGILADLDNGLTRANIQSKYNLTGKDLATLFKHPKLKGKKTKVAPKFILIDDTAEVSIENNEVTEAIEEVQAVEEAVEDTPISKQESWEEETIEEGDSII